MKVLHVINGLGVGGAERSLAELLPALANHGVESVVVCLYHRPQGVERTVKEAGIPVMFLEGGRFPGRVAQLRRIVEAQRPDLMHTTIFEADQLGRLACVGTCVRVLTSLVNTSYAPARLQDPNVSAGKLTAVRLVDGWTARRLTDHFHAITGAVKDAAIRDLRILPERITVVERGRDPTRLGVPSAQRRERSRQSLDLYDDEIVIVTAGRQEFQKGQVFLVEATRSLLALHPEIVLLMAGRAGCMTSDLRRFGNDPASGGRIRFLGHRDDLPDVLAAADIFAFPSLFEGLGGAVIEAMALGLPIVATDIPAMREVVDHGCNAELVPAGSAGALAAALCSFIDDPDRRSRYGLHSRKVFDDRFTLSRSANRMADLYSRVLDEQPVRTAGIR